LFYGVIVAWGFSVRYRSACFGAHGACGSGVGSVCDAVAILVFGFWFSVFGFCLSLASANSYPCFMRRPCAGQHLLFFAAAKKSRQKKAAFEPPVPARMAPRHAAVELSRSNVRTL
jgi:hypothetical protein